MKVLVIGSGGREHALCWKLKQSPVLTDLYCAPGNPGIDSIADTVKISVDEIQKLADFAADLSIDLTVVGPELPLVLGLADEFARRGLKVFGPSRSAAELEGSKVFAKEFMRRHSIPSAEFFVVDNADDARRAAAEFGFPAVLKADGLAAGKGVLIPRNAEELDDAIAVLFEERRFGASSDRVVVEQCLVGEELSLIALTDGKKILPMATSKDYKRIYDNDQGPNTGGMGAHSPAGVLSSADALRVLDEVMVPTIRGLDSENRHYVGFLYAGLMMTDDGPRVLEFNVRLGDPEAQPLLMRLEDDLLPVLDQAASGGFEIQRLHFLKEAAACLVLASSGYPESPSKGDVINGLENAESSNSVEVFHAATTLQGGDLLTAGGRVLNVCATAPQLRDALRRAYAAASEIRWPGLQMRRDIGRRVLEGSAGQTLEPS